MLVCFSMFIITACACNEQDDGVVEQPSTENQATCSHEYQNGSCKKCGVKQPSEGLEFELNPETDEYTLVGAGTCMDSVVVVPSVYNGKKVTEIGRFALSYGYGLFGNPGASLEFSENLTEVIIHEGIKNISSTFVSDCINLRKISIPSSVELFGDITYAIDGSSYSYSYSNFIPHNYPNLEFYEENGLRYLGNENDKYIVCVGAVNTDISVADVKQGCRFLQPFFMDCYALNRVNLPSSITFVSITELLVGTEKASVYYDGTVESWSQLKILTRATSNLDIQNENYNLYIQGQKLDNLVLNSPIEVKQGAFRQVDLESITIGSLVKKIEQGAFQTSSVKTFTLQQNPNITKIGYWFSSCSQLQEITIPSNITQIESFAFGNCNNVTDVKFLGTKSQWLSIEKGEYWESFAATFVNCADGDVFIGDIEGEPLGNGCGTPKEFNSSQSGLGSGHTASVNNYSDLFNALQNPATFTLNYSDSVKIDFFTLKIPLYGSDPVNFQTDCINVYQDQTCYHKVTDLNSSNQAAKVYGALANEINVCSFVGYDMATGIAKIAYINDFGSISYGYCSASELGLKIKEANEDISVYSDSSYTNLVTTIPKDYVFVVNSENSTIIKYSNGNGFTIGYIKSSVLTTDVRIMVSYNDQVDFDTTGTEENKSQNKLAVYKTEYLLWVPRDGLSTQEWMQQLTPTYLAQGSILRYYSSQRVIGDQNKVIESAQIRYKNDNVWNNGYVKEIDARIVEAQISQRTDAKNSESGTIKVFATQNGVYAQINSEFDNKERGENITMRFSINAEVYFSAQGTLIRINSFDYDHYASSHHMGINNREKALCYVRDLMCGEWMTLEQAKFYLTQAQVESAEFVSPFNMFLINHFDENGNLKMCNDLQDIYNEQSKQDYASDVILSISGINRYLKYLEVGDFVKNLEVSANFNSSNTEEVELDFSIVLGNNDIFSGILSDLEIDVERELVIENANNTVIPTDVMQEINDYYNN